MLSFEENVDVAKILLQHAARDKKGAEKPLTSFVTATTKALFKSKDVPVAALVEMTGGLGKGVMLSLVDKLAPADVLAVVKRLDPINGAKAAEEPVWARKHLGEIVTGDHTPVSPPPKQPKPKAAKKPVAKRSVMGETDAFSAKRKKTA